MGMAAWSEWSSTTLAPRGFCLDKPSTPTNFGRQSASTAVAGSVVVSWDLITTQGMSGGDDISNVYYELQGGPNSNSLPQIVLADPSTNVHTITVPSGTTWYFRVRSVNSRGDGSAWSATEALVSAAAPGQPASLTLTSNTPGTMVLDWTVPTSDGGTVITGYEVKSGTGTVWTSVESYLTSHTMLSENPGQQNQPYFVRALNAVGAGPERTGTANVMAR
jgi:hypothetical protein